MFDATHSDPSATRTDRIRPALPMPHGMSMGMCMCAIMCTSPAADP